MRQRLALRSCLALALLALGCAPSQTTARTSPAEPAVPPVVRTDLTELPPPDAPAAKPASPFADFLRYAMEQAARPPPGKLRVSALIDQSSLATAPRRSRCLEQKPAVLLDLDPGAAAFDLDDPPSPAPGLAELLAQLRISGVHVLWIAGLPQADASRLRTVLRATELDPDGSDTLLLRRGAERKQLVRQAAAHDWCILAIAGDTRSDFDEVYDYLRDPDGPVARMLEANIGAGWFLTPLPIE